MNGIGITTGVLIVAGVLAAPVQAGRPADRSGGDPPVSGKPFQAEPSGQNRMPFNQPTGVVVPTHPTRVVGSSRAAAADSAPGPQLYVLLPEEVAITTQSQPSLFWYLSQPIDRPVRLTLSTPTRIEPVLDLQLNTVSERGIQRLDLSKLPVHLKPAVRYDWVVAITGGDGTPPGIFARSVVWRINTPEPLASRLAHARDRRQRAAIAAEEGLWIDALAEISNLIEHKPNDTSLRKDRADLLRQVGFQVVIEPQPHRGFFEEVHFPQPTQLGIVP